MPPPTYTVQCILGQHLPRCAVLCCAVIRCNMLCVLQASAEIMRLLAQSSPGCAFEKASIDEAYIDITQLAVSAVAV